MKRFVSKNSYGLYMKRVLFAFCYSLILDSSTAGTCVMEVKKNQMYPCLKPRGSEWNQTLGTF